MAQGVRGVSRGTSWSGQRVAFPPKVKALILERDGHRCVAALDDGSRCPVTEGLQADHIVNVARATRLGWTEDEMHDPSNGQALCPKHHEDKSKAEHREGVQHYHGRRYRPKERHPGLIDRGDGT